MNYQHIDLTKNQAISLPDPQTEVPDLRSAWIQLNLTPASTFRSSRSSDERDHCLSGN